MPNQAGQSFLCYQPCDLAEVNQNSDCWNGRHTCYQAFGNSGEALTFGICNY